MELYEAIRTRRTVRKFTSEPVSPELLQKLVERALYAPAVADERPWRFYLVTNREFIGKMAQLVHRRLEELFGGTDKGNLLKTVDHYATIFAEAPALILIAAKPYHAVADDLGKLSHETINEMRRHPDLQSIGAAVENMLLSAAEFGLGGCWLSGLMAARTDLEELLGVKEPWQLVTAAAFGKPAAQPQPHEPPRVQDHISIIA
ncbi:MAG: nitroreductase family protein [candidate division KSB1 bacterium]|nr:nitroreductase family protein [candidate division KSB1 bacterium]